MHPMVALSSVFRVHWTSYTCRFVVLTKFGKFCYYILEYMFSFLLPPLGEWLCVWVCLSDSVWVCVSLCECMWLCVWVTLCSMWVTLWVCVSVGEWWYLLFSSSQVLCSSVHFFEGRFLCSSFLLVPLSLSSRSPVLSFTASNLL
jgi:hypothetical protein